MPWKNGGGETVEIACFPEGAGLSDFGWRVSTARVAVAGPFSLFPGVDRTLSVLTGDGLMLDFADGAEVRLDQAAAPFAFPADVPVAGTPLGGAITDLNVMTRRGVFTRRVTRVDGPVHLAAGAGSATLAYVAAGMAHVAAAAGRDAAALATGDTALVSGGAVGLRPGAEGCRLLIVEIAPL